MIFNFDNTMPGMPALSGTAGTLASVLRTCLVTGGAVTSVVSLTVASGVATATYASAHGQKANTVIQVAGATPGALNGLQRIASVTTNALTFPAPGVPDGAATGAITTKIAPAGWQELFAGTLANVGVFKPGAPEATGCVLRVDDTGTNNARIVGYETLADASTGTGPFPTPAQKAGGLYWAKSDAASTAARAWWLWADERAFGLLIYCYGTIQTRGIGYGFGDLGANKSGDPYACYVAGSETATAWNGDAVASCLGAMWGNASPGTAQGLYLARAATGLGSAVIARKAAAYANGTALYYSGAINYWQGSSLAHPNPADNSLRLSGVDVLTIGDGFRGLLPGIAHTPQIMLEAYQTGDKIPGEGAYAGRTLMAVRVGIPNAGTTPGTMFVDLSGPWRA